MGDVTGSTSDLLSDLPENVTDNILVHLPIRDAARTSVLSKKWKHNWETISQIVFDISFTASVISKGQPMANKDLLLIINRALLLHRGSILKFALSVPQLLSYPEVDHIIEFLSRNGVQDLTLGLGKGQLCKLPLSTFSCLELRHLNLSSCLFKPPATFNGFNKLVDATFERITFDADAIANFLLKCPLLENLTVEHCFVDCLDLCAPNLKFLKIGVDFKSICFRHTPLLTRASIEGYGPDEPKFKNRCGIEEVFGCLPALEDLYVGFYFLMILAMENIPKSLPTSFNNLKALEFDQLCFHIVPEISCALCLIRSSPCLQKLKIKVFDCGEDDGKAAEEFLQGQESLDIPLNRLEEVNISCFMGTSCEMEFIKLLLAKSPMLKTMRIRHSKQSMEEKIEALDKAIIQYPRASPNAKLSTIA